MTVISKTKQWDSGGEERRYPNIFCSCFDAQEGALKDLERAEALGEHFLELFARAKIRECERLVLLAYRVRRFRFVPETVS
jgi:hypothetical protein